MTVKVQTTVRVSPDTMTATEAAAQAAGVSRGAIVDRWLADSARRNAPGYLRSIKQMLLAAAESAAKAGYGTTDTQVLVALDRIISTMRVIAGIDE